ncbi:fimbrial biogenesis chaperone [Chryseobacterium sp. A301]
MRRLFYFIGLVFLFVPFITQAQTGITVGPPRTYFISAPGESQTKKILVSNPSKTGTMNLTVSFNDWSYDLQGGNVMVDSGTLPTSLSGWLTIMPQTFFTLAPGESRELEITLTAPTPSAPFEPVHTTMLFITQTNPSDSFNEKGAMVKVAVRTGVKIYHQYTSDTARPDITFTNFKFEKEKKQLLLNFTNDGNTWTDGAILSELVSQTDGSVVTLADQVIYTMPKDHRQAAIKLPENLKPGKYLATATFSHTKNDVIKMAELSFTYE